MHLLNSLKIGNANFWIALTTMYHKAISLLNSLVAHVPFGIPTNVCQVCLISLSFYTYGLYTHMLLHACVELYWTLNLLFSNGLYTIVRHQNTETWRSCVGGTQEKQGCYNTSRKFTDSLEPYVLMFNLYLQSYLWLEKCSVHKCKQAYNVPIVQYCTCCHIEYPGSCLVLCIRAS